MHAYIQCERLVHEKQKLRPACNNCCGKLGCVPGLENAQPMLLLTKVAL